MPPSEDATRHQKRVAIFLFLGGVGGIALGLAGALWVLA